jgi:hypothetical protein
MKVKHNPLTPGKGRFLKVPLVKGDLGGFLEHGYPLTPFVKGELQIRSLQRGRGYGSSRTEIYALLERGGA